MTGTSQNKFWDLSDKIQIKENQNGKQRKFYLYGNWISTEG